MYINTFEYLSFKLVDLVPLEPFPSADTGCFFLNEFMQTQNRNINANEILSVNA